MQQDWIWGLIGGGLIGTAAAIYLLMNGRIMGASGVLGGLVDGSDRKNWKEPAAMIAGMVLMPMAILPIFGTVSTNITPNLAVIIVAGLMVGVGTRLANGCTSGHGVCGISRLSLRGIVATVFYLLAGGITMLVFRHLLGII